MYALNHPTENGDRSFTVGQNKNGVIGYWQNYVFDPGIKGTGYKDGYKNLEGVGVGTRFVRAEGGGESYRLETANNINGGFGAAFGAVESFGGITTIGTNLVRYTSGWGGNQYVSTIGITKLAKGLGWVSLGLGTILDIRGIYKYYHYGSESEGAVSLPHAGLNLGVGIIGMEGGPPGWAVATIYYGIGLTIGWNNAIPSYIEMEDNRTVYRDNSIMNYSDYKY